MIDFKNLRTKSFRLLDLKAQKLQNVYSNQKIGIIIVMDNTDLQPGSQIICRQQAWVVLVIECFGMKCRAINKEVDAVLLIMPALQTGIRKHLKMFSIDIQICLEDPVIINSKASMESRKSTTTKITISRAAHNRMIATSDVSSIDTTVNLHPIHQLNHQCSVFNNLHYTEHLRHSHFIISRLRLQNSLNSSTPMFHPQHATPIETASNGEKTQIKQSHKSQVIYTALLRLTTLTVGATKATLVDVFGRKWLNCCECDL